MSGAGRRRIWPSTRTCTGRSCHTSSVARATSRSDRCSRSPTACRSIPPSWSRVSNHGSSGLPVRLDRWTARDRCEVTRTARIHRLTDPEQHRHRPRPTRGSTTWSLLLGSHAAVRVQHRPAPQVLRAVLPRHHHDPRGDARQAHDEPDRRLDRPGRPQRVPHPRRQAGERPGAGGALRTHRDRAMITAMLPGGPRRARAVPRGGLAFRSASHAAGLHWTALRAEAARPFPSVQRKLPEAPNYTRQGEATSSPGESETSPCR